MNCLFLSNQNIKEEIEKYFKKLKIRKHTSKQKNEHGNVKHPENNESSHENDGNSGNIPIKERSEKFRRKEHNQQLSASLPDKPACLHLKLKICLIVKTN